MLYIVKPFLFERMLKKSREAIDDIQREIKNQNPPRMDSLPVNVKALIILSMRSDHE